jgi:Beta-xylosidase
MKRIKATVWLLGLLSLGIVKAQYSHFDAALGLQHADITTADIDNDGDLDIVASGVTTEGGVQVPKSYIWMNNNGAYQLQGTTNGASYYQNPIFEPDLADPTVIRGGDGWFYAYGTENTWTDDVSHLVPVVRSKNLIQWQYVRDAFASRPTWKTTGGGIWAPDVTYMNSRYYMFYSMSTWGDSNPGIGMAISNTPAGPFTDQGKVFDSSTIGVNNSIDPFFFQTQVGDTTKSYLFWGSFSGIYGIELSSNYKTTVGQKFKIAGNAFEASYIVERNNKFYFFGSVGSCCDGVNSQYHVNVAVANSLKGPYYDKNGNTIINDGQVGSPFLSGSQSLGWVGPGHNSKIVTDDNGNDYFIYHAIDINKPTLPGGATRRPIMMDKITWINGWPEISGGVPSKGLRVAPVIK